MSHFLPQVRLTTAQRLREESFDTGSPRTSRDTFGHPHFGVQLQRNTQGRYVVPRLQL